MCCRINEKIELFVKLLQRLNYETAIREERHDKTLIKLGERRKAFLMTYVTPRTISALPPPAPSSCNSPPFSFVVV